MVLGVFAVMSVTAYAAATYPLSVNGENFISDKLTIACGSGTAKFNPKTQTLTLNNAQIISTSQHAILIRALILLVLKVKS